MSSSKKSGRRLRQSPEVRPSAGKLVQQIGRRQTKKNSPEIISIALERVEWTGEVMQSKFSFLIFFRAQPLRSTGFCLQNVSKSGCLLRRASDLFYPRISLARSLSSLSLSRSNTHTNDAHAHTRCYTHTRTHKREDTPGPSPPPPQS